MAVEPPVREARHRPLADAQHHIARKKARFRCSTTASHFTDGGAGASALAEAVADAPVVVRVELGSVTMTAREWARLGPGDVVELGRPLGSLVTLRAGGVALAEGELVEVEGELGVRLIATREAP